MFFIVYIVNTLGLISEKIKEYPSSRYLLQKTQQQIQKDSLKGLFGKRKYLNNIKQPLDNQTLQILQDNRVINLENLQQKNNSNRNIRYVQQKRNLENEQTDSNLQNKNEQNNKQETHETHEDQQEVHEEEDEGYLNHQEKDIKTLLTSALKSSKDSSPIIIINQPDESAGNLSAKEQMYIPPQQDYTDIYEQVDLNTVDVLIQIISNLENIYDAYYKHFPALQFKFAGIPQKSQFEIQMQKLNNFAREVISKSHLIMKDLNFYENRVKLMSKGQQNMMKFFFLDTKYKRLRLVTKNLEGGFVEEAWKKIQGTTEEYDELITFIQENSIKLYRFNQYFADNIKQITKTYSLNDTVLDNFDQVMKFSVKLLEIKQELEQVLTDLKVRFVKFHMMKQTIALLLFQIDKAASALMTDVQITQQKEEEKKENEELEKKEQLEKKEEENNSEKDNEEQKYTYKLAIVFSIFMFIFQLI